MSEGVQRARAQLEMDPEGRAPEGVLTSPDGRGFGFSGWTELAAAIEEWRSVERSARSAQGAQAEGEGGFGQ